MINHAIIGGRPGTSELKQGWPQCQVTGVLLFPGSYSCLAFLNPDVNMNKDPAFLFYSKDFLSETTFLTDSQTGKYIKILSHLHLHGHLSRKHILSICKRYDAQIFSLLEQDSATTFFSRTWEPTFEKRKAYINSRKMNASKKAYAEHTANATANGNIKELEKDFTKGIEDLI